MQLSPDKEHGAVTISAELTEEATVQIVRRRKTVITTSSQIFISKHVKFDMNDLLRFDLSEVLIVVKLFLDIHKYSLTFLSLQHNRAD